MKALFVLLPFAFGKQLPNIIVFLADDAGFNDFGFTRAFYPHAHTNSRVPHARTPALDALAADGVVFKHHYAYRYCSPSRASFLTGRLPYHAHESNPGISEAGCTNTNYTMISSKLAQAGYTTYQIGKWYCYVLLCDTM